MGICISSRAWQPGPRIRKHRLTSLNVRGCAGSGARAGVDPKTFQARRGCPGHVAGLRVVIAKPQTFMNLCGSAVQGWPRSIRFRPSASWSSTTTSTCPRHGCASGPRGLWRPQGYDDIIRRLGTQDFPRHRFGKAAHRQNGPRRSLRPFDRDDLPRCRLDRARGRRAKPAARGDRHRDEPLQRTGETPRPRRPARPTPRPTRALTNGCLSPCTHGC